MDTQALKLARLLAADNRPERLNWDHLTLSVTDPGRAERFWREVLGFVRRPAEGQGIALGTPDRTLVVLEPGASRPVAGGHAGLYHVAFAMPSQAEFSRRLMQLRLLGIRHAPVDHLMSKAIYLSDPDGHGIEIAYETPERFGRFINGDRGFALVDAAGKVHSGREPLDIRSELALFDGTEPSLPVHGEAVVAHLHLHVPHLGAALTWFEGIGFVRNLTLPDLGLADMGAGAPYTHRLALNLWAGPDAIPSPVHSARLLSYALTTGDRETFAAARSHLTEDPRTGVLQGTDPTGVPLKLEFRSSNIETEHAA